jgi:hypothetical protein
MHLKPVRLIAMRLTTVPADMSSWLTHLSLAPSTDKRRSYRLQPASTQAPTTVGCNPDMGSCNSNVTSTIAVTINISQGTIQLVKQHPSVAVNSNYMRYLKKGKVSIDVRSASHTP